MDWIQRYIKPYLYLYLQYMPNKRHSRFGIKKFELCEALTGYVMHVELYAGKDFPIHSDMGQAHAVVMKLLREANVLNKGYYLFTDNFYTKPVLATELSAANTLLTGTVCHNSRGLPVLPGRLDIGESVNYRSGDMMLVAWREKKSQKKPVLVLSTSEGAGMMEVRTGAGRLKMKPKPVSSRKMRVLGHFTIHMVQLYTDQPHVWLEHGHHPSSNHMYC